MSLMSCMCGKIRKEANIEDFFITLILEDKLLILQQMANFNRIARLGITTLYNTRIDHNAPVKNTQRCIKTPKFHQSKLWWKTSGISSQKFCKPSLRLYAFMQVCECWTAMHCNFNPLCDTFLETAWLHQYNRTVMHL